MNQASGTFLTSLKETSLFAYRLYPNCHEHLHSFIFSFFFWKLIMNKTSGTSSKFLKEISLGM